MKRIHVNQGLGYCRRPRSDKHVKISLLILHENKQGYFQPVIWDYILWLKHLECEDKKPTMSLHELGPYSCSTFSMSNYLKVNAKSLSTYLVSLPRVLMFATAGSAICILILVLPTNKKLVFLIILFTVFPVDC